MLLPRNALPVRDRRHRDRRCRCVNSATREVELPGWYYCCQAWRCCCPRRSRTRCGEASPPRDAVSPREFATAWRSCCCERPLLPRDRIATASMNIATPPVIVLLLRERLTRAGNAFRSHTSRDVIREIVAVAKKDHHWARYRGEETGPGQRQTDLRSLRERLPLHELETDHYETFNALREDLRRETTITRYRVARRFRRETGLLAHDTRPPRDTHTDTRITNICYHDTLLATTYTLIDTPRYGYTTAAATFLRHDHHDRPDEVRVSIDEDRFNTTKPIAKTIVEPN